MRIGVAEGREFEVDTDEDLRAALEKAYEDEAALFWTKDNRGNDVGLPLKRIVYIVIEGTDAKMQVGFA